MWVKDGDRRLWIRKHRDLGVVVYDPHRSGTSPTDVLLFILDKGTIGSFKRRALRVKGVWIRPESAHVSGAVWRYSLWATSVDGRAGDRVDTDWLDDYLEPWHEFDPDTGHVVEAEEIGFLEDARADAEWWSDILEWDAYTRGEDPLD